MNAPEPVDDRIANLAPASDRDFMRGYMYILKCADDSYYVGSTRNIEVRFEQHQSGGGAEYTKRRRPVELVFCQEFDSIEDAFGMEKRIQKWSRAKREALITGDFDALKSAAKKEFRDPIGKVDYRYRMTADWRENRVDEIRALINKAAPGVVEEAKWKKASNPDGVPTFTLDGLICTVETYKAKVKVTFAKGGSLPDPAGLFLPATGVRRAIDIAEADTLDADAFVAIVEAAVALNRA